MLDKWGKDGLVVVTVNVNFAEPEKAKDRYGAEALEILRKNKVTAINLFLDEDEKAMERLRILAFPAIYVFDRKGAWTAFKAVEGARDGEEKDIERFVQKLVIEK